MVIEPEIVVPEIGAALARGTSDTRRSSSFAASLRELPSFVFVPVD
jgi:hypothetical protein